MVATVGEDRMPALFKGVNKGMEMLSDEIRNFDDEMLVRTMWKYADAFPDDLVSGFFRAREKMILKKVWEEDVL